MADIPTNISGSYASVLANAQNAYDRAKQNITTQRNQRLDRYGLNEDGTLNTTNPYGLRQQLDTSHTNNLYDIGLQRTQGTEDYNLGNTRRTEDYNTGLGRLDQNQGYLTGDYNLGNARRTQDYNLQSGRMGEDHNTALQSIQLGMDRAQRDSGLQGDFNGDTLTGVHMGTGPGGYQNLLTGEGQQLDAARMDAINRGLGTHGVAAQQGAALRAMQAGDRSNFRQQVIDTLTDQLRSRTQENTNYGRGTADLLTGFNRGNEDATTGYNRGLADLGNQRADLGTSYNRGNQDATTDYGRMISGLNTQTDRENYGYGVGKNDLYSNLTSDLGGFDQQLYQAGQDYNTSTANGLLADIIQRIQNGDFNPVTDNGNPTGPNNPSDGGGNSKGVQVDPVDLASMQAKVAGQRAGLSPAELALAERSAGMNAQYGIKPTPPRKPTLPNAYNDGRKLRG